MDMRKTLLLGSLAVALSCNFPGLASAAAPQEQPAPATSRPVGTIKNIAGNNITMTTDAGGEITVLVLPSTRIIRVAPGQKDLTGATVVKLQDLQAGDRILVRGTAAVDPKQLAAISVVLMKATDVAQKQERERQDWERRGIGGLVNALDPTAGTIQIKTTSFSGTKVVTVRTSKDTVVRRYSPTSVKFEDAVPSKLEQVKLGDQLRARGTHNADGTEFTAEEVVSGTFRNIAGLIMAVDPTANTLTVNDLATKKPVVVKITSGTQLHKLPVMLAQGIAMRLKGSENGGEGQRGPGVGGERQVFMRPGEGPSGRPNGGGRPGGMDIGQMLSRMPAITLAELQKGEAVMVVATADSDAVTLLSGVEPILTDSRAAMLLQPWNLGGGAGEGGPQ